MNSWQTKFSGWKIHQHEHNIFSCESFLGTARLPEMNFLFYVALKMGEGFCGHVKGLKD